MNTLNVRLRRRSASLSQEDGAVRSGRYAMSWSPKEPRSRRKCKVGCELRTSRNTSRAPRDSLVSTTMEVRMATAGTRSDAALLAAARSDPRAFRELYDRYAERVHGYHLRRSRRRPTT